MKQAFQGMAIGAALTPLIQTGYSVHCEGAGNIGLAILYAARAVGNYVAVFMLVYLAANRK